MRKPPVCIRCSNPVGRVPARVNLGQLNSSRVIMAHRFLCSVYEISLKKKQSQDNNSISLQDDRFCHPALLYYPQTNGKGEETR